MPDERRGPAIERFMDKVSPEPNSGCWLWTATTDRGGYGRFWDGLNTGARTHRWSYEHFVGPIPKGLTLDHLCRVRSCVNPDHLEPVTLAENILRGTAPGALNARKTHCINGHPFSGENLGITKSMGKVQRVCKTCNRLAVRAYTSRKKAND